MKIYKIDCEWDMGFSPYYATRELAQEAIDKMDWSMVDMTAKEAMFDNYVSIEEINVKE